MPTGVRYSGQSVTIRISFKRNGEVLGKPMITHYREGEPDAANQEAFTQAVREALVRCSPMPFTDKLGGGGGRSSVHLPLCRFPGNGKIAVSLARRMNPYVPKERMSVLTSDALVACRRIP